MMTGQTLFSPQLSAKLSCGLPIALLALSLTFGPSAVRAEPDSPTPSWREMLLDPIMTAVHTVEARLSSLEASIALSAGFFTSQQIATQKLCVYDNTGEFCADRSENQQAWLCCGVVTPTHEPSDFLLPSRGRGLRKSDPRVDSRPGSR
jgi:hypothetical protein